MNEKPLLTLMELLVEFQLNQQFVQTWTDPKADRDFKNGDTKIPAMPAIRPGERGVLFPRELVMKWLLTYFGSGYGCGEETNKRKGAA